MSEHDEGFERWRAARRWARCSAGPRGWFWYAKPSVDESDAKGIEWENEPSIASGFEPTPGAGRGEGQGGRRQDTAKSRHIGPRAT